MCLRQIKRLWRWQRIGLDKPLRGPEDIKTLLSVRGVRQQDFEGLLWGRRIWQPQPISYQSQGPRRGRRNVRGQIRRVQAVGRHRRGQPYPRLTKVTEGESGTPSKTALPSILNKRTNVVGQLWGHGGGAIPGEAVTSTLNTRSWQSGRINEEITPE